MARTWILFEDGSRYAIACRIRPKIPDTHGHVSAYIVPTPDSDGFVTAAELGVNAAHDWCWKNKLISEPVSAIFALEGLDGQNSSFSGQSGGMCFAIAFARQYLNSGGPDIAATGVIDGLDRVTAVGGIRGKIQAARGVLKAGDYFFYPRANHSELGPLDLEPLRQRQIHCHAVDSITELMSLLFASDSRMVPPGQPVNGCLPEPGGMAAMGRRLSSMLIPLAMGVVFALAFTLWPDRITEEGGGIHHSGPGAFHSHPPPAPPQLPQKTALAGPLPSIQMEIPPQCHSFPTPFQNPNPGPG